MAVPPACDAEPVREFGSWTADLVRMTEWLKSCSIGHVVMQSTGVYWIAVYDVLEQAGFEICLSNARDTKNLPGRKTDVQESQWLMKLHTFGLLRNSFRPTEEIRTVRTIPKAWSWPSLSPGRILRYRFGALSQLSQGSPRFPSRISAVAS